MNIAKDRIVTAVKGALKRYFVDAMSAMALGLFSSLIIGLILSQLGKLPYLGFLLPLSQVVSASSPVVGAAIGASVAWGLGSKPLVMFSCCVAGAFGYQLGGPVGAYVAAVAGSECGRLVAGKTGVDIVVTPIVTILTGGLAGQLVGPGVQSFMRGLGGMINLATDLSPVPMGILIAVLVGMALTAPISSAALCIMLDLSGVAAGAAVAGCSAQMIGFAVASFKENGWGGLISQGIGTSMLQFGNIVRRPQIWIAPTVASAVVGPVSTRLLGMTNTATGAGMGTSGLVGQFGAFAAMGESVSTPVLLLELAVVHFILPALVALAVNAWMRRIGWVRDGDMLIRTGV